MNKHKHIIFFDSECVFCNFWVKKLIKIDNKKVFKIAPLKGKTASEYLFKDWLIKTDSVVVYSNKEVFIKSNAIFEIINQIGGFLKIFYILKILPKSFLDFIYDFLSKNRIKWFGKQNECILSDDRFLD